MGRESTRGWESRSGLSAGENNTFLDLFIRSFHKEVIRKSSKKYYTKNLIFSVINQDMMRYFLLLNNTTEKLLVTENRNIIITF